MNDPLLFLQSQFGPSIMQSTNHFLKNLFMIFLLHFHAEVSFFFYDAGLKRLAIDLNSTDLMLAANS